MGNFEKSWIFNIVFIFLVIFLSCIFLFYRNIFHSNLKINEVSFSKNSGNDWIEIYNPSMNSKSLKNMYLSDNPEEYNKFRISADVIIPPKGFRVIYGKDTELTELKKNNTGNKEDIFLQTNFNIKNGEIIYLLDHKETVIDSLTVISDEKIQTEHSIGRFPDGYKDLFLMSTPTPKKENKKDVISEIKPR